MSIVVFKIGIGLQPVKDMETSGVKFIYWFAYYNLASPSVRYRGYYPLQFLEEKHGIKSFLVIPGYSPSRIFQFLHAYLSALLFRRKDSLIIIQRIHSGFIYSALLKLLVKIRKTNTFYDLDDADYLEHPPETIHYFIRNCSALIVGSRELSRNLSSKTNKIIVNTSPTPGSLFIKGNKNELLTIGWIGDFRGGHKEGMLKFFFPALSNLPFRIKLVLLGVTEKSGTEFLTNYFRQHDNVILEIPQEINWNDEKSIQQRIAAFDIGIATLLDNELQRSKSAFKTKEYLNNGVPVLSSDLPENNFFVTHGRNGFLCTGPEDFRKRILEIHNMEQEDYDKLSAEALATIPGFSIENYCKIMLDAGEKSSQNF